MGWLIAFGVIAGLAIIMLAFTAIRKRRKKTAAKREDKKLKPPKTKKKRPVLRNKNGKLETKPSYCDTVDKFLYRKEVKIFILISKVLPKGYIAFPKISLGTILEPIGSPALFNSVKDKTVDFVIFDQETMKPKAVVDVYDGSIGDEQLDMLDERLVIALKSAQLPVVSFKVKTDYDIDEIKKPIYEALEIETSSNE